jgi:hypothetical protein
MACTDIATAAGTTLSIGAALPATYDKAGYEAVSWTAVGELGSLSAFGKEYQMVTWAGLSGRTTCKVKGTYDSGGIDVELAQVVEDAGQVAMIAHLASDLPLPYKVRLNDDTATKDVGTSYYFTGLLTRWQVNPGADPNGVVTASARIEITGDIVTVNRYDSTP